MSVSDARATLELAVLDGLSRRSNLTRVTVEVAHILIPDILDAMFRPCMRWAVQAYLEELESQEEIDLNERG
jgi:hypothetical protein